MCDKEPCRIGLLFPLLLGSLVSSPPQGLPRVCLQHCNRRICARIHVGLARPLFEIWVRVQFPELGPEFIRLEPTGSCISFRARQSKQFSLIINQIIMELWWYKVQTYQILGNTKFIIRPIHMILCSLYKR